MRIAIIGAVLLVLGGLALVTGVLPAAEAMIVVDRVWPILLFVVAVTVVAELAAEAGLFAAIAARLSGLGRGRAWMLWLLVAALAITSTMFLSLDTTAVLLTPVVIVLARHAGLDPLPFAFATVWLANTASLLLPVSNLTNLLAEHALGSSDPARFAALMLAPAVVACLVPLAVLAVVFRRSLAARYQPSVSEPAEDRVLFVISAIVVAALLPLLVSGLPVWMPASAAALVLVAAFAIRRRGVLRPSLVPWGLLLFASGLFLVVEAGHALGMTAMLGLVAGRGEDALSLLQLGGTALLGANLLDNLPAYLALEPLAESPVRMAALLTGVNAGSLITPWASLATLLWHQRLVALGVELRWRRYLLLGLVAAPLTVAAAVLALALTR